MCQKPMGTSAICSSDNLRLPIILVRGRRVWTRVKWRSWREQQKTEGEQAYKGGWGWREIWSGVCGQARLCAQKTNREGFPSIRSIACHLLALPPPLRPRAGRDQAAAETGCQLDANASHLLSHLKCVRAVACCGAGLAYQVQSVEAGGLAQPQ